MGIVLDSSVLIAAERTGANPRKVIEGIIASQGDVEAVLSVITIAELAHGIVRANSAERRSMRQRFLDELLNEIPVELVTVPVALRAGKIDGSLQANGVRVALEDLLIGATALELGYSVVTHNVRHFRLIPELQIKQQPQGQEPTESH